MKRVLCFLLVLVMCFAMATPAFAATEKRDTLVIGDTTYHITTTSNAITVVDEKNSYEAVFVRSTGDLTITDLRGKSASRCVNINAMANSILASQRVGTNNTRAGNGSNSSKDNEYAYERSSKMYNNKYYTFWEIQIPNQIKMTWANTNNTSALEDFKDNVDELRELEDSVAGAWGTTILAVVLSIVGSFALPALGAALVAALSALVGGDDLVTLLTYGTDMKNCRINCEDLFGEVIVYSTPT